MQLTMSLDIFSEPQSKNILQNNLWIDVTSEALFLGFSQKVEVSQALQDALQPQSFEEDEQEQWLYDALWLGHHYLCLDQRASFSFTLDYMRNDLMKGRMVEHSLRLRLETYEGIVLLGLLTDFPQGRDP